MPKKKIILISALVLLILLLLAAVAFLLFKSKQTKQTITNTAQEFIAPKSNALPKIKNLGINIEAYNPQTGMAGDVKFEKIKSPYWDKMMFEHFGYQMKPNSNNPNPGRNVHPEYYLPKGTKIFAVSDGEVTDVKVIYSGDYSILVNQKDAPDWILNYEHVLNPQVKVGDKIKAGQVLAEVSHLQTQSLDTNYGKWALAIFKGAREPKDIISYCPYLLFEESVKAEMQAKVAQLISDWETFIGENVYDEENWLAPGCAAEQLRENK